MGAGEGGVPHQEGGDRVAAGAHQGAAVLAVLRVVPRRRRARAARRRAAPRRAAPLRVVAHAHVAARQAAPRRHRVPRRAAALPRGQRAQGVGRQEAETRPPVRGELLLARRTIVAALLRQEDISREECLARTSHRHHRRSLFIAELPF